MSTLLLLFKPSHLWLWPEAVGSESVRALVLKYFDILAEKLPGLEQLEIVYHEVLPDVKNESQAPVDDEVLAESVSRCVSFQHHIIFSSSSRRLSFHSLRWQTRCIEERCCPRFGLFLFFSTK